MGEKNIAMMGTVITRVWVVRAPHRVRPVLAIAVPISNEAKLRLTKLGHRKTPGRTSYAHPTKVSVAGAMDFNENGKLNNKDGIARGA